MNFAHLADTHLGFRQYGLFERETDFYSVFDQIIEKIVQESPDFVIHSGDLFEFSKPPINALLKVQKGFERLKDEDIPIYAIAGNHDIIMRKNAVPPHKLYKTLGLKLIDLENTFYTLGDVFIGGLPYLSSSYSSVTRDLLKDIEKKSMGFNKKILVLHQAIDRYLPFDPELSIADIPQNFNYYAFGHIHERIIDDFGEGKLVYPGSPEIWRIDELKSFKKKGKGFFMVNMDLDVPEVRKIDIKLPREIIKETVEYHRLDEEIGRIQKNILNLNKKPLLHITIDGGHFERSDVYERLNRALSNLCLSVRPNYRLDSLDTSNVITSDRGVLDIKEILRKKLEEFENQELSDFAIGILNELSNGDFKRAEELVQEFYEVSYDN